MLGGLVLGIYGWVKKKARGKIEDYKQSRRDESIIKGIRKSAEWDARKKRAKIEGRKAGRYPKKRQSLSLGIAERINAFENIIGGPSFGLVPSPEKKPQKEKLSRPKGHTIIVDGKKITITSQKKEKKKRKKRERKERDFFDLI